MPLPEAWSNTCRSERYGQLVWTVCMYSLHRNHPLHKSSLIVPIPDSRGSNYHEDSFDSPHLFRCVHRTLALERTRRHAPPSRLSAFATFTSYQTWQSKTTSRESSSSSLSSPSPQSSYFHGSPTTAPSTGSKNLLTLARTRVLTRRQWEETAAMAPRRRTARFAATRPGRRPSATAGRRWEP